MKRFKRISLALIIVLALVVVPVFSQARYSLRSSGSIETSTNLVLPAKTWLYGAKLYADASSSFMTIYNAATYAAGEADSTLWVDEIGEATQYDSVTVWYEKPIYCSSGVSVGITTGIGYLYYGPAPTE